MEIGDRQGGENYLIYQYYVFNDTQETRSVANGNKR